MIRFILTFLILCFSTHSWAEGTVEGLVYAKAPINRNDIESIKRGAKLFATNCMSCHTLIYMKYNKIAQDAGVTIDKMPINVKTWPYNVTPPDLSLEANYRGIDWIYTYLHTFYTDPSRPTGVNNLLLPGTAMPAILAPFQGQQVLVEHPTPDLLGQVQWYDKVKLVKQGTMSPEEFDAMTADLVNFLAYSAEPYRMQQERIGIWVIAFLLILFVFMYALKKEYWKDVKYKRDE